MQNNFSFKSSRILTQIAVFLIPFYFFRFSIGPIKTNVFEVAVLVALLNTLYIIRYTKKVAWGSSWPYVFLLIAFVSIFPAYNKTAALGIFKGWFLVPIVLYWLIINLFGLSSSGRQRHDPGIQGAKKQQNSLDSRLNPKGPLWGGNDKTVDDISKIILPLFAGFVVVTLWAVLQSFGAITMLFYQKDDPTFLQYLVSSNFRLFGPFESPNYLAMYLVPVFFLTIPILYYFRRVLPKYFWLVAITLGFAINATLFTGSRAGMLAFVIPLTVIFYIKMRTVFRQNFKQGWVLIVLILVALSIFSLNFSAVTANRSESNSDRLQIWHYSIDIGASQPVFGIGLGSFYEKIAEVADDDIDFIDNVLPYALHPHNVYLAMWLNLGILGLAVFIVLIKDFFQSLWSRRSELIPVCLMMAMAAILIHGLFDTTYFKNDLSSIFWLIIALAEVLHVQAAE